MKIPFCVFIGIIIRWVYFLRWEKYCGQDADKYKNIYS
jgi:hypothetical protein